MGLVIAAIGTGWALSLDGLSFVIVALLISLAQIPRRKVDTTTPVERKKSSMLRELANGWSYFKGMPVIRSLLWLTLLLNISSFIGPLYAPLVEEQLHSGPAAFGFIEVAGIIGGIVGVLIASFFEKRFGAGRIVGTFWAVGGLCTIGIGVSTSVILTMGFLLLRTFLFTIAGVCLFALEMAIISENYRGRFNGITRSFATIAIPLATLIAGGLGEILNMSIIFSISGIWSIIVGLLALANPYIRKAKVEANLVEKEA